MCVINPYTSIRFGSEAIDTLSLEIKSFASSYIALREVEKKTIQEWALPIHHDVLKETLCKIVLSQSISQSHTTDRYKGGKKEQALENLNSGNATEEDHRILNGEACAWCGDKLPDASFRRGVESTYCSQECAEEGRLRRGGTYTLGTTFVIRSIYLIIMQSTNNFYNRNVCINKSTSASL